jgi:F-type H+-transporting ATPase subunit b
MYLLAFAESIQLVPDGTLFVHVTLILVMIWVLNRTLYRPINKIIESRDMSKGGKSGEAVKILADVTEKESRYNRELFEARSSGYELIEAEQKQAAAERDRTLTTVKTETAERVGTGKAELEKQRLEARANLTSDAEKIADSIAATILRP